MLLSLDDENVEDFPAAVTFTVFGLPQPAGSKRAVRMKGSDRVLVIDANRKSAPWKQEVAGVAREAWAGRELMTGPLRLDVTFFVVRPKGHYGSGRNAAMVRLSAPAYPTSRPDTTKLLRGVEDALTSVLWRDDAQVVDQFACKRFGDPARCEVRVTELA